jgi:2-polyprenyl-6-methoxyphenol hydroxylase-like FAD-dependent oxidoreductase
VSPVTQKLLDQFSTKLLVTGGDACVPPNPLAAYGATLACEAADMVVQLAVAHGHLKTILTDLEKYVKDGFASNDWIEEAKTLKVLFAMYYDARSRSENYFQWVQTLICNIYSLPPLKP